MSVALGSDADRVFVGDRKKFETDVSVQFALWFGCRGGGCVLMYIPLKGRRRRAVMCAGMGNGGSPLLVQDGFPVSVILWKVCRIGSLN